MYRILLYNSPKTKYTKRWKSFIVHRVGDLSGDVEVSGKDVKIGNSVTSSIRKVIKYMSIK